ncbi:SPW repeat protein [Dyadobacter chenwenxiniae]|uniref:SPW repeat protein n=1 Tax=Dyadobacter chenwenxiniae TaxID=2906456 RepID=A0A9X1PPF8_9BACT|nr:SPW repeat protein [Dyadobacter chenwenxiniae]MCF0064643.1 SPW repeat protein [Dyadobacter chenwenxiniae]UON84302.1 SPW repeat protein [Dyadobacter chenwenxiniae]
MKIISTKVHSILDYMSGILLIASPWIFQFNDVSAAKWVALIVGAAIILMSLFTNYEGGVLKTIPMPAHLNIDIVTGLFLAASPWLLDFNEQVYLPHLILGIFEIMAGVVTDRTPVRDHLTDLDRP